MKKKNILILVLAIGVAITGTYFFKKANAADEVPVSVASTLPPPLISDIGDEAPDFNLKNIDGKLVSLSGYPSSKGFIIIFTSNHCPFSKAYEDRVIALNTKYVPLGYPVIALNPNDPAAYEEDSYENMKARSAEKGFTFPYLVDDKNVGLAYGAVRTPHVFVVRKESGKNIVKYMGAIDDNAQDPSSVTRKYVEDAVDNLLQNKPVVTTSTKAIGCSIKWRE